MDATPFTAKYLARRDDPATSKAAAVAIARVLGAAQQNALEAVQRHTGKTANEIADADGVRDIRTINRRLGELEHMGLVTRGPARACKLTGRVAATWTAGGGA